MSENLYVVYANNPTNRIDPLGTSERPPNVDTPEAIIRQFQEESIIAPSWRISAISDKEVALRKQLDNVLVIGPHGTMSQAAYRQKEENYRNSALLSGGRGFILGAMLFDIARRNTDDPSLLDGGRPARQCVYDRRGRNGSSAGVRFGRNGSKPEPSITWAYQHFSTKHYCAEIPGKEHTPACT